MDYFEQNRHVRNAKRYARTMENAKRCVRRARKWRERGFDSGSVAGFLNNAAYWHQEAAQALQELRSADV